MGSLIQRGTVHSDIERDLPGAGGVRPYSINSDGAITGTYGTASGNQGFMIPGVLYASM